MCGLHLERTQIDDVLPPNLKLAAHDAIAILESHREGLAPLLVDDSNHIFDLLLQPVNPVLCLVLARLRIATQARREGAQLGM